MFGNLAEIKETMEKAKEAFDGKEIVFLLGEETLKNYNIFGSCKTLDEANDYIQRNDSRIVLVGFRKKRE